MARRSLLPTHTNRDAAGRAHGVTRAVVAAPATATLLLACVILLVGTLSPRSSAVASPGFVHGPAQSCQACHHAEPPSFAPCLSCHESAATPNQACTLCHPGKTTTGQTCWACHAPGATMPPPTNENCIACHGSAPHLGASGDCTSCHDTPPTPHHDDVDQEAPTTCTGCHQHQDKQTHDQQACTACHAADTHPSVPTVPTVCSSCHPSTTFGQGNCLLCHAGAPFNGKIDNDVHDATIPDAPISATSCTSCHPGKQKHAGGAAGCRDCHSSSDAFHHGTAASPGYPACTTCHSDQQQHGSGKPCDTCHQGAQHQSAPPTPAATKCNLCHSASTYGSGGCYDCHTPPIYHVTPHVGPCSSCHGGGRGRHAGQVACTTCHRNINGGHHIGRVTSLSCGAKGCHLQEKHMGQVRCQSCHGRAQHDRTPLNLPADTWSVCQRCHTFTNQALAAGVGPCSTCHDTTQHRAAYRVEDCGTCHADKKQHQNVVPCELCHIDPGPGHHRVGTVKARECSACHVGVQVHASAVGSPVAMTCTTCHEGSVHGMFAPVASSTCIRCHEEGTLHADGFQCTDCHWPAVHSATPNPGKYGAHATLPIELPHGVAADTSDDTTSPRDEFTDTGSDLALTAGLALALVGIGAALHRRERRRQQGITK